MRGARRRPVGRPDRAGAARAGGARRARAQPRRPGSARRRAGGGRDPRGARGARGAGGAPRRRERDARRRSTSCGRSSTRCASLLDAGDLLGVSDQNAGLHGSLLEIAGHGTVARLVATLNSQLVRFQYRTILLPGRSERSLARARGDRRGDRRRRPRRRRAGRCARTSSTSSRRSAAAPDGEPSPSTDEPSPETRPSGAERARAAPRRVRHRTSTSRPTSSRAGSTTSRWRGASPELGLAGFGLKSHYTSTAERAAVVRARRPGVDGRWARSRSTARSAG